MRAGRRSPPKRPLKPTVYPVSTFGWALIGIAILAIRVARPFSPPHFARRNGHTFIGYLIFSLFFSPLALRTAYLVHERRQPAC